MLLRTFTKVIGISLLVSGCTLVQDVNSWFEDDDQAETNQEQQGYSDTQYEEPKVELVQEVVVQTMPAVEPVTQHSSQMLDSATVESSFLLQNHLQSLGTQLINNSSDETINTGTARVAVTSFVPLGGTFTTSEIEGKQIQESLIYELYRLGVSVVDYKATDFIRVTPQGDFALTQDFMDLKNQLPISHVIVGTLTTHGNNLIVNSRLVTMQDKSVVSVAQAIIPGDVINDFYKAQQIEMESRQATRPSGVEVSFSQ